MTTDRAHHVPLVLVVDDEPAMVSIVTFALRAQGFRTVSAADAVQARRRLEDGLDNGGDDAIDLVVLDVMLPRESGIDLCRHIRASSDIPVILLTAKSEIDDRVTGLEAGADDYVVKPFSPRELALRVDAVLRRGRPRQAADVIEIGKLRIDRTNMRVSLAGTPVDVSTIEYRVLCVLADQVGAVVRWQDLLEHVWHPQSTRGGRAMLKTTIYRLRAKLGDDSLRPTYIVTVRGVGYQMVHRARVTRL